MPNLTSFKQLNTANSHRSVFVISGDWAFCCTQLKALIDSDWNTDAKTSTGKTAESWYLGDDDRLLTTLSANIKTIPPKQAKHYLGRQCQQLIINALAGLDLNAFGALTGCVVAGGSCIILIPTLTSWAAQQDTQNSRFNAIETPKLAMHSANNLMHHLKTVITQSDDIAFISNNKPHFPDITPQITNTCSHPIYKSEDQQLAVAKIIKVATGHRNRPLVLTADRGRGKSSALGLAASELIKAGKNNIIITAPQRSSIEPVFERLSEQLSDQLGDNTVNIQALQFVAIDALIKDKPKASLVLVDEAAAIAAPLLTELVSHYSRIVLTSTITGYEGTGRSFEIRFKHKLTELKPQWQQYHLNTPIRFAGNDPLEGFTNRALMLDAQAAKLDKPLDLKSVQHQQHDRAHLTENSQQLAQIVGLLSLAHYKTSSNDIRHLLNGNNIDIHTLYAIETNTLETNSFKANAFKKSPQQQIIAVAMVAKEGGFESNTATEIAQGQRRPKGHLLPLTLSAHSGLIDAPNFTFARIVRIAVHPALHQQGLGSQMLSHLHQYYQQQDFDFVGSSFGANQSLLSFWLKQQYKVLRIGLNKEASSNEYSALVLKALKQDKQDFVENATLRFGQQFLQQIKEDNPQICPFVVMMLLKTHNLSPQLDPQQNQDLHYYLNYQREYEFCSHTLQVWCIYQLNQNLSAFLNLPTSAASLLIDKLIKQKPWPIIIKEHSFDGKKSAATALKRLIKRLNEQP